jgi:hypothetical protein
MSYDTSKPPRVLAMVPGGGSTNIGVGGVLWTYSSTADAIGTVTGSSYFSNGYDLGMRKGQFMLYLDAASTIMSLCYVTAVTSGAGATVAQSSGL